MMMKILMSLFILFAFISTSFTSPLRKCPSIVTNEQLQILRKECVQYENYAVPQTLTINTRKPFLCVLYISSYTRACSKNVQVPATGFTKLNISSVCSNVSLLTEGVEGVQKLLNNQIECAGVCLDLKTASVADECNAALYLNNLTHTVNAETTIVKTEQNSNQVVKDAAKETELQVKTNPEKSGNNEVENPAQNLPMDEDVRAEHPPENQATEKKQQPVDVNVVEKSKVLSVASPAQNQAQEKPVEKPTIENPDAAKPNANANSDNVKKTEVQSAKNAAEIQVSNPAKPKTDNEERQQQQEQPDLPPKQQQQSEKQEKQGEQPPENQVYPQEQLEEENENIANKQGGAIETEYFDGMDDNDNSDDNPGSKYIKPQSVPQKPDKTYNSPAVNSETAVDGESYFFSYFMMLCIIIVLFYVGYHNKQKIRAIVLEGPRGRRQHRSRRPNSANYHKLDSNLEEAITSSTANKGSSNVIY